MPKRVVIVGGGPVGLWSAALFGHQASREQDPFRVTVIEQRARPMRQQIVLLDPQTVHQLPPTVKEEILRNGACYVQVPFGHMDATCYAKPSDQRGENGPIQRMSVQLRVLEKALERYAKKVGVKIVRPRAKAKDTKLDVRVTDDAVIANGKRYAYDLLVGADGKDSIVRKAMGCKAEPILAGEKPQYAVVALLEDSKGKYARNAERATWRGTGDGEDPRPQESWRVFRTSSGDLLYVGVTVPPDVARKMLDGKEETIAAALERTCERAGTPCKADDANYSLLEIVPTQSSCFVRRAGDRFQFLLGDAAMNTFFFTGGGLNRGMRMAERLNEVAGLWPIVSADAFEQALEFAKYQLYFEQLAWQNKDDIKQSRAVTAALEKKCRNSTKSELIARARRLKLKGDFERMRKEELCLFLGEQLLTEAELLEALDAYVETSEVPAKLRTDFHPWQMLF